MSELDNELRGLRDELNTAIPLPDVDHITSRAHARRRLQIAAAAVVMAVALAVPVLRWLPSTQAAGPHTPPDTSYLMDFADAGHGYALARKCVPGREGCAFTLYRTGDGGRTWARRTLPPAKNPKTGYFSATMYVLGPDTVVFDRPAGDETDRIHSTDGGRSWQVVEHWWASDGQAGGAPLEEGALLTTQCSAQPIVGSSCLAVGTIRPDTGQFVPTPEQPPLVPQRLGSATTESGRYWVVGRNTTTGTMSIAVTLDAGATWWTSELRSGGKTPGTFAVAERDGVMYLTASDASRLLSVWRSVDDGRRWDSTYQWDSMTRSQSRYALSALVGDPIAAGDGTLLVSDGTDTYVSRDMGTIFNRTGTKAVGAVRWTRAGYLRQNADEFALSADGLHWRTFTVR
jgi:photosystem II stability/assembly factor-like uncharacterized protein